MLTLFYIFTILEFDILIIKELFQSCESIIYILLIVILLQLIISSKAWLFAITFLQII